jgi:hypothetical protein
LELDLVTTFCMIGSGAYAAEPALHARGQDFNTPLSRAMYNIYEAKTIGGSSPFVRRQTIMHILKPPSTGNKQVRADHLTPVGEKVPHKLYKRLRTQNYEDLAHYPARPI